MGSKTVKNAAWIISCKLIQACLGLIVTLLSARYLGPSGYGLINYAASIAAFFVPVMQLGLNATLVQELINDPKKEGETLGTALTLSFISSLACIIGIAAFSIVANYGETTTIVVCILYSVLLIFQSLEMIQYWFQAKLLSKYTSITMLIAYLIVSAYKIVLLILGSHPYWFAVSQAIDYCIIACILLVIYRKIGTQKLRFSGIRAREMVSRSKHYILSGLMVTIFAQTDRVMLKLMIDETAVGYYSAAVACAAMTAFVFVAIIDSFRPSILESKKNSESEFNDQMKILYAVIIIFALLQSVVITCLADVVVKILYGSQYLASVSALRIIVWYTTFSYIGAVRDIWILANGKQNLLWIINISGAALNVVINAILIPHLGVNGAALASLITQIFTNVVTGWIIKPIRPNNKLMFMALNAKFIFEQAKQIKKIIKKDHK